MMPVLVMDGSMVIEMALCHSAEFARLSHALKLIRLVFLTNNWWAKE